MFKRSGGQLLARRGSISQGPGSWQRRSLVGLVLFENPEDCRENNSWFEIILVKTDGQVE
jgi:uncharacterized protein (DUF1330 family)